jgi:hypothetical protein
VVELGRELVLAVVVVVVAPPGTSFIRVGGRDAKPDDLTTGRAATTSSHKSKPRLHSYLAIIELGTMAHLPVRPPAGLPPLPPGWTEHKAPTGSYSSPPASIFQRY